MNIYENNKKLLTTMGGDSANLATDYEVRKAILNLLGGDSSNCNSIYDVDLQILNIYLEGGGGTGGDITLSPITITENGVYTAGVGKGYNTVTVEVPEIPLTDITITENGVYKAENGGYGEVTVNVAGGGGGDYTLMKVKSLTVDNNCIVDGYWPAEYIDTSSLTTMDSTFYNCSSLQQLDVSGWNTDNVTKMISTFYNCSSLQQLDVSGWNTDNVTGNIGSIFYNCSSLQQLDVSGWNTDNVTNMGLLFSRCNSLQQLDLSGWNAANVSGISSFSNSSGIINYVGGRTIDEVISNNITILNGLNVNASGTFSSYADRASLRALINGLADRTGQTTLTLNLGSTLKAKLTEEDIAVATAKNWTIS